MKNRIATLSAIATVAFATTAQADTLNLDFQNNAGTVATSGILPAGPKWEQITHSSALFPARADDNSLLPDTGAFTGASGNSVEPGANAIQADSISAPGGASASVSITDLRIGDYYKIIVYNAQEGGVSTAAIAGGQSKPVGPATNPATVEDMVEGLDYVIFDSVKASSASIGVTLTHPTLSQFAGMQIQGWFPQKNFPHKTDLQISKRKGSAYKGDNKYSGNQSLTIRKKKNANFYFRLQNDSTIGGTYGLRAKGTDRRAVRKYYDRTKGRKNITAKVKRGVFQTGITQTEYATIQATIRLKNTNRKASTLVIGFPCDDPAQAKDKNKAILKN